MCEVLQSGRKRWAGSVLSRPEIQGAYGAVQGAQSSSCTLRLLCSVRMEWMIRCLILSAVGRNRVAGLAFIS